MNQGLIGVVSTIVALGAVGVMAPQDAPRGKQAAVAPAMTPEQQEALRQAFSLPPGSEVEVEIVNRDGGSVRTREHGRGVGAGAVAEGDKLDQRFDGTPPRVGRGADGSQMAEGGAAESSQRAAALRLPPLPWQNPLFWIGLAALGVCGFGVYAGLRRLAAIAGVAAAGLLAAAFYPAILLWAVAAVLLVIFGPYIYAEFKKRQAEAEAKRQHEALRAVVAGVERSEVPVEAQKIVKQAIAKEADASDKAAIDEVKRADSIGKYRDD